MPKPPVQFPSKEPESSEATFPFLRLYHGTEFVRNYHLKPGTWIVGRDPAALITLADRFASRRHFQIEYFGENRIFLQDLNSSNGTFVNGRRVSRISLGHGDEVVVGETRIVVSHRAFAKSNVIQFPEIRTEPQVDLAKLEATSQPSVTEVEEAANESPSVGSISASEEIVLAPLRRPFLSRVFFMGSMLLVAVGVSFFLNWWVPSKPVSLPDSADSTAAQPKTTGKILDRVAELKEILRPRKSERRIPVESRKPKKPVSKATPDMMASLDRSLQGLSSDVVGAAEGLKAPSPVAGSANRSAVAPKKMTKANTEAMDVEIQMPRSEEIDRKLATERGGVDRSKSVRTFDAKQYQLMLKERLRHVDGCYREYAKDQDTGKISISLVIASNGSIRDSQVDAGAVKNRQLLDCIRRGIEAMRFDPPPWDGFSVTYGFRVGRQSVNF